MPDLFDNLVYEQRDVISFKDGIPGFESYRDFVIVKVPEHDPFEWLVCIEDTKLRFIIAAKTKVAAATPAACRLMNLPAR